MPDLAPETISDLTNRLKRYLQSKKQNCEIYFLAAGGSAAVYKVETADGPRAFKVFDPKFVNSDEGSAEKHRLTLQERLIGHNCDSLIQTYNIETAEETAFIEMEYINWPQLKEELQNIPDNCVSSLISQLVSAVKFLESLNIVHRDIKPENIHISPDHSKLKLLDLGVLRELDPGPDAAETDHGNLRLFLATAQYSSPEYLFRLDEPSESLWKALNYYQVGAVLHDLIMKEAIFQAEINTGNRWLVAKAVLTKSPSFIDGSPNRLASLKSTAQKCLTKDMNTRLKIINWDDFLDNKSEILTTFRNRLKRRTGPEEAEHFRQEKFDRDRFEEELTRKVKENLISICKTDLPLKSCNSQADDQSFDYIFDYGQKIEIIIHLLFDWQSEINSRTATIKLSGTIQFDTHPIEYETLSQTTICCANIDAGRDEPIQTICIKTVELTSKALDAIDFCQGDTNQISKLTGIDLQAS
ncbi:protein kinase [Pseudomonas sp. T8]|uniref:protein kinase domain-containing protein n=1 Tax=Pseudomonas sp. T8 TaxID=645292 RepID=UPI00214931FA|nr:protein kinase [Pseudomonas sp. T8]UUT22295.1 protein kinase [Pseudomonas sp. T8]